MVQYEKLTNKNFSQLEILVNEFLSLNKYKINFIKYYLKSNLFKKSLLKNNLILILLDNEYIGYIWFDYNDIDTILINAAYIKDQYVNIIKFNDIPKFNGKILIYQTYEDSLTTKLLSSNLFVRSKITKLLEYNIKTKLNINCNVKFRKFTKNKDEFLRCEIQNSIFNDDSRTPLKPKDIRYEEKQLYYNENFCIFMLNSNNTEIGYGQIIFNNNIYTIVNFGIVNNYRNKGYGECLLNYLINLAHDNNISKIFIRVEEDNFKAINLYFKTGFKIVGNYTTWIKT
ncbi:GNAT family N-acetyltransferase [Clostridium sp. Ade.TY]|uniref:GNAT family N-acetyltransferase n=1 Tax=Clostridium sp. Ade.TY TaxID=1391647 RepID=UPI00040F954E|nr:GNAT family N-acetyltransferase [Clostridium sp. Ade.TY]